MLPYVAVILEVTVSPHMSCKDALPSLSMIPKIVVPEPPSVP